MSNEVIKVKCVHVSASGFFSFTVGKVYELTIDSCGSYCLKDDHPELRVGWKIPKVKDYLSELHYWTSCQFENA